VAQCLSWLIELQCRELDTRTKLICQLADENHTPDAAAHYKQYVLPLAQSMALAVEKLMNTTDRLSAHPDKVVTAFTTFQSLASAFNTLADAHPCITMAPQYARKASTEYFGKAYDVFMTLLSLSEPRRTGFGTDAPGSAAWRAWLQHSLVRAPPLSSPAFSVVAKGRWGGARDGRRKSCSPTCGTRTTRGISVSSAS